MAIRDLIVKVDGPGFVPHWRKKPAFGAQLFERTCVGGKRMNS
jgi:hypothetical protein